MIQGGHYEPWRNRPSSLYAYERLPTIADHLHYASGKLNEIRGESSETQALGGGHAHCGTLVYLGDSFPADFRNTVFMCNIHGRRINHDILRRKGSGYTASHGKDFMIAGDPWFMGVTLRTGPDGSVFVSDWSDTGECHTYKPDTTSGRIYKITYGKAEQKSVDLTKLSDDELVKLQLHRNDWYVRQARRLLQERVAKPEWKGEPVHAALRKMLASAQLDVPQRLRAMWALKVTGGLGGAQLLTLLDDTSEHVRAWSIQLLCEGQAPASDALAKFREIAKSDPSPVVRLYMASALQRLPLDARWGIVEGLLSHAADADDANLPLMDWYGIEPLVPADPAQALRLAVAGKIPQVRQFIARRVIDDAAARGDKGDLAPLVTALSGAEEAVQLDLLKGAREGLRGRKSLKMPETWPALYARLARSDNTAIREHGVIVALVLGDPQALVDLRKTAVSKSAPTAERLVALEALIEKRPADLAPMLHDLLTDKAVRRLALRGLGSFAHEATPQRVLTVYPELTVEEKQDAIATLASRKEYALALLGAVEKKAVARADVSAYVARQLYAMGDAQVSDKLRQVWGEVRDTAPEKQKQLARYKALLTPGFMKYADPSKGRLTFTKTCAQCHKLFGEGNTIGPDLTGYNRAELDYLLVKIVDPSSQVAKDYHMSIVATQDGRVLTGIVVERSSTRLILQTATERIILGKDDIETVKDSPLSIMPEGQLDALTKEQVRDLISYLSGKTQVALPAGSQEGK
jgi:putative heme-binding domain-containing protein